jgi:hypothetical protein
MGKKNKGQGAVDDDAEMVDENASAEETGSVGPATAPEVSDAFQAANDAASADNETGEGDSAEEAPLPAATIPRDIHSRLSVVAASASTAPQHIAGVLNRVEILMGSLKSALPDAIAAIQDEDLGKDLATLFSVL